MAFKKIVPTVEELQPRTGPDKLTSRPTKKWASRRTDVVLQFHCPVDSCTYGPTFERHFSCIKYLKQHYKKVHTARSFVCSRCGRGHVGQADLKAHEFICGTVYECSCGSPPFLTKEALLTHAKRKGHPVPPQHLPKSRSRSVASPSPAAKTLCAHIVQQPVPMMMMMIAPQVVVSGDQPMAVKAVAQPRSILPKPDAVPLPTVAAMALTELASYEGCLLKTSSVSTQSEAAAAQNVHQVPARHDSGIQCQYVTHRQFADASTQTARGSTKVKKQVSRRRLTVTTATLPQPPPVLLSDVAEPVYAVADYADDYCWSSKLCQTYPSSDVELDVDVNFSDQHVVAAVSSGTQTSPRSSRAATRSARNPVSCDRFLDSPLRDFLAAEISKTETSAASVQQWSSIETQTEVADHVHDLESIPYDQLLSNMETQTSDLSFFTELGGLYCDIQTQTVGASPAQLTDTETQTFLSFLESSAAAAATVTL